jgi:hypothetical protein
MSITNADQYRLPMLDRKPTDELIPKCLPIRSESALHQGATGLISCNQAIAIRTRQ